jgi:hypothetical protein
MEKEELELSLMDQFIISPLGQWMSEHKNLLYNVATAVIVILAWGVIRISRAPDTESVRHVQEAYAAWKASPQDRSLYQALDKALEKTPSMRQAFRSEIAEIMLINGDADQAEEISKKSLQELRSVAPLFAEYAEISLHIGRKQYQDALEKSVTLKEKMTDQKSSLYFQNLLRIALLQEKVGNKAGEMAAWRDLEVFSKAENNKTLQERTLKGLGDQTITFQSFIEERKKQL